MSDVINKFDFKNQLFKEAKKQGFELNDDCLRKLETYKNLLLEWNNKINLTAIVDEYEIIMKHFIDCLEIVKYIKTNSNIIDIGTGAGFPGIIIAIYFDGKVNITLVDSLNKRINFLNEVVKSLNLKNVNVIHARAEEIGINKEYREKFDYAVARAVAPLNVLLEYDVPFLKSKGKALLLKGNNVDDEIKKSGNALNVLNSKIIKKYEYSYNLNEEIYLRNIIEVIKNSNISLKYPR